MSKMHRHRHRVLIGWTHPEWGLQQDRQSAGWTSVRRAISHALLACFSDKSNRDRRRDAHAAIDVKAWRLRSDT